MLSRGIHKRGFSIPEILFLQLPQILCPPSSVCENAHKPPFFISSIRIQSFSIAAANRISRIARAEAQCALFDYLHGSRGVLSADAEHISNNSPYFVQKVLSKLDNKQDTSRALSNYFLFNPINEFEPFLESLGLNPHELGPLLPRNSMFLRDDEALLDNFHVLCSYGIPRSKVGKIYKEAKEIFGYQDGVLSMTLRAYEELCFSKSTVIELVSCCPSLLVNGVDNVGVLAKLKGLGFGSHWIARFLSDKTTYDWNSMSEMMGFLGQLGYSEKQMAILFKTFPALLFDESGKQIHVLVGRLLKLGFKTNQVLDLFLKNPQILLAECIKNLLWAVCFLFEIGMETEALASIVEKHIQLLGSYTLKRPKTVKKNLLKQDTLRQIMKKDPLKLIALASKSDANNVKKGTVQKSSSYLEKTAFLLSLGYVENSEEMAKASKKFRGRGDELQERFYCLIQAGLDCDIVSSMIKHAPNVLNQSKEVLEKKIYCLRSRLGYPLESIAAFPSFLCYDLQRIDLRFSMYAWLRERGAAKPKLSLSTLLACSDARFVRYFVDVHPEGAAMWESLKELSPSS